MQRLDSPTAQAALAQITHIYTDLDGTLLAPGGRLLTTHHGKPSLALAKALLKIRRAGVEIVLVTGRGVSSTSEIMRLTNLEQFIAEMGCITQYGYGANAEKHYNLGYWTDENYDEKRDGKASRTPHDVIAQSGVVEALLYRFKGRLELHAFKGTVREVTFLLRGQVNSTEAEQFLAGFELPLQLLDNGILHPKEHTLVGVEEIHGYHLMPRGSGKGEAVAVDMALKGLAAAQALAIGDSAGDVYMGRYTGSFVLVNNRSNALPHASIEAAVANPEHLFTTTLPTADGWVEFAHALLKAKCYA